MSGRANCNPHRFQPSMGETRTTRALSLRIVCRSFTFLRMGAEGISSDTRDRRRKGLRIASSAPPALSLSKVQNSRNSLPCPLTPRTKAGMARKSRGQRRRSDLRWAAAESPPPQRMHNHSQDRNVSLGRVTTDDTVVRESKTGLRGHWLEEESWVLRTKNDRWLAVLVGVLKDRGFTWNAFLLAGTRLLLLDKRVREVHNPWCSCG